MENSFKQKAVIDSMLQNSLGQLGHTERLKTYKSELRPNVIALLKQYYPSNEGDKKTFYTEAFNSELGYYDAELLLNNLFANLPNIVCYMNVKMCYHTACCFMLQHHPWAHRVATSRLLRSVSCSIIYAITFTQTQLLVTPLHQ